MVGAFKPQMQLAKLRAERNKLRREKKNLMAANVSRRIPRRIKPQSSGIRTRVLGTGVMGEGRMGVNTIEHTGPDSCIFYGQDYIGSMSVQGTGAGANAVGDILFSTIVNPRLITGSALYNESLNWEKWKIRKVSFQFITTKGTNDKGSVFAFIDTDPVDTFTNDPTNLNVAVRSANSVEASLWNTFEVAYPPDREFTDIFIAPNGNDTRMSQGGVLYAVYAGGNESATSTVTHNILIKYEIEFRIRSLGNGGTSLGANTTFSNANPVTNSLLKGAIAQAGSQIPVSLDADGNFSIPKAITDVNNILVSAFVGETNVSGMTELEKLALNLTQGTTLEGVPSWTGIFANTSFEQTANWLLEGGSSGIAGALTAAQFGGTYLFPTLRVLFTAVPKTVTSLGQLSYGIFHIPSGLSDPNPTGEVVAFQSEGLNPTWSGAGTDIFVNGLVDGLNDPMSSNNQLWIPGGISPNAVETTHSVLFGTPTAGGGTTELPVYIPVSSTNSALQAGILYVDYFMQVDSNFTGGATSCEVYRHSYGSSGGTLITVYDTIGPYGATLFESLGILLDMKTIPVDNWIEVLLASSKTAAAGSHNAAATIAITMYPDNGVFWADEEEKREFAERLRCKHLSRLRIKAAALGENLVEVEDRSKVFDCDDEASLDRVKEVVKPKAKMTELSVIQKKRA